jgi:hypothetical protein
MLLKAHSLCLSPPEGHRSVRCHPKWGGTSVESVQPYLSTRSNWGRETRRPDLDLSQLRSTDATSLHLLSRLILCTRFDHVFFFILISIFSTYSGVNFFINMDIICLFNHRKLNCEHYLGNE